MPLTDLLRRLRRGLSRPPEPPQRGPDFIDVRELAARLDEATLMRSADAYFAGIGLKSEQCRKPWGNPADAVHQTRHLGLVLEAADLFRGARVLDFGCATGWLTLGLSQMGCDAIGVDIAPSALRLAEQLKAARPPAQGAGTLSFAAYDGHRLPVDDASLDRIICFDAFHHVRDQAATLREFARVLKPGGRAAFIEPGPEHSKTPQSQAEMARFAVIENDVDMAVVSRHAIDAGFEPPRMLVQFQQPFTLEASEVLDWSERGVPMGWGWRAMRTLGRQLTIGQCFFIVRRGTSSEMPDSRRPEGLGAKLVLEQAARLPSGRGHAIRLRVRASNVGSSVWRSAAGSGQVNLGVQLTDAEGHLRDANFARLRMPSTAGAGVVPGESVVFEGTLPVPDLPACVLRVDLVSELVAWFSQRGAVEPLLLGESDIVQEIVDEAPGRPRSAPQSSGR